MSRRTLAMNVALAAVATITPIAVVASVNASPAERSVAASGTVHPVVLSSAEQERLIAEAGVAAPALVKAVGLSGDDTFKVKDVLKDSDGGTHVRVDRFFKGVQVVGGDMVIDRNAKGEVVARNAMFDQAVTVGLEPKLSLEQAKGKGVEAARAQKEEEQTSLVEVAPEKADLVIWVSPEGKQSLAYRTISSGTQADKTPSRVNALIDADSGESLASYDEVAQVLDHPQAVALAATQAKKAPITSLLTQANGHGIYVGDVQLNVTQQGGKYLLSNPQTGNFSTDSGNKKVDGTQMAASSSNIGNGTNRDRLSAGVDTMFGADKTFEYYKNVLGRNGIWNNGKGSRSRTHYDHNYVNAFWDGRQMTYGDGQNDASPLTELDVSAHEMSHGVNQNSANLAYRGDAGGLNEANSDIFGTAVEWYANLPKDTPDYLIGEAINIRGDGKPLRYMDQPSKDGRSPDCWSSSLAGMDPHNSSGPLNHWFYLTSEGSGSKTINGVRYNAPTCNNKSMTGVGHDAMEKIWYRTLSTKLGQTSTYAAARDGAIKSAVELYGTGSKECVAVQEGFDAISVKPGSANCGTPRPTDPPTPIPTDTPTTTPTDTPTDTPTAEPTSTGNPGGGTQDDTFTMDQGQTSASFNALANDSVPAGTTVSWRGLPAGPSLYVRGNADGTLQVTRGSYMRGTYTCTYLVDAADGNRQEAKVTLVLK